MRQRYRFGLLLSFVCSAPVFAQSRSQEIFQDVNAILQERFPDAEDSVWAPVRMQLAPDWVVQSPEGLWGMPSAEIPTVTDCKASDRRCDPDFLRLTCRIDSDCTTRNTRCEELQASVSQLGQAPRKLCLAAADRLMDRMYNTMVAAEKELDFVSLSLATGRFHKAFVNALSILSQKKNPPAIRLLYSGYKPALPNFLMPAPKALDSIMSDVARVTKTASRLKVNLAWLAEGTLSWNHAKIIVADGDLALQGGHNFWDEAYLTSRPLFDLSMEYRGEAAAVSRDFVNTLWKQKLDSESSYPPALGRMRAFSMPATTQGDVLGITLGRMGPLGANPSDRALQAMIDLAQESVLVNQQDLYNQVVSPLSRSFVHKNIVNAVLRGVRVKIVQSNNYPLVGGFGSTNGAKAYKSLLDDIEKGGMDRDEACALLSYAPFRFSAGMHTWDSNWTSHTIGTHSKFVMVDDAAFYIGSHNLYPADLQEFGILVTDEVASAQLRAEHWDRVWEESAPSAYRCPG